MRFSCLSLLFVNLRFLISLVLVLSVFFCAPSSGKLKAKQAFKDEVDINSIVSRFTSSGVPIPAPTSKPLFLDMASLPSNLHDAMQLKLRLRSVISTFSPTLQAAYNADPAGFTKALDARLAELERFKRLDAAKAIKEASDKASGKPQDLVKPVPKGEEAKP